MTSQPSETPASAPPGQAGSPAGPPGAAEEKDASRYTLPLRQPAAFALLVVNGVTLLFAVVDLLAIFQDWSANFLNGVDSSFGTFVGVVSVTFPLLAVLLATHIKPVLAQARLITVGALIEYGVSALFGVLCLLAGFLHGLTSSTTVNGLSSPRRALEAFLIRGAWLAVLAVAALAVYQVFQGMYAGVKPTPTGYPQQPGYPQPGYPYAYGQPGYPQQPYPPQQPPPPYGPPQPGWAGPSGTHPTYAPAPAQPHYGGPTGAFQPPYAPPGYQAPPRADVSSPFATYANPATPAGPTSAPPTSAPPSSAPPSPTSAPPTQPAQQAQPAAPSQPPAPSQPAQPDAHPSEAVTQPMSMPRPDEPTAPSQQTAQSQPTPPSEPTAPNQPDSDDDDAQRTQVIQPPAGPEEPTQRWSQP